MESLKMLENNKEIVNTISSREVAEMLGKDHSMLLREIDGSKDGKTIGIIPTLENANFAVSNYFIRSTYKSGTRYYKCYEITKMGCEILGNKQQGEKGILFTAKYVDRFNEMEKELKKDIPIIDKKDSLILSLVKSGGNPIQLAEYTKIVEEEGIKKGKDGENRLLSLSQVVEVLNQKYLDTPRLTTVILNEFMSEILEWGEFKVPFLNKRRREFIPNQYFIDLLVKEGGCLTGKSIIGNKVKIQYSVDMIKHILKYKSQLEQFITNKIS